MSKITLEFYKCIQDSQEFGSDNEHMMSRVFFTLDGKPYECNIRQPYGGNFSSEETPIEVETPQELKRVVNYLEFRDAVESYFREIIGGQGHGIRITGNVSNIRMMNNIFGRKKIVQINRAGDTGGAW